MMKLAIADLDGDIIRMMVYGKVSQMPDASDPLHDLLGPTVYSKLLLLDMQDVPSIDSGGVAWLLGCNKNMKNGGGKLVVHSLTPTVASVFKLMKLELVIAMAKNADDAKELLKGAVA